MTEIFIDGIRSVAVANGVARIELLQLKRGADETKLEPQIVATLMVPAAALKDIAAHLATSLDKLQASAKQRVAASKVTPAAGGDLDDALGKL